MAVSEVVDAIYRAMIEPEPKARYVLGNSISQAGMVAKRLVSDATWDGMMEGTLESAERWYEGRKRRAQEQGPPEDDEY